MVTEDAYGRYECNGCSGWFDMASQQHICGPMVTRLREERDSALRERDDLLQWKNGQKGIEDYYTVKAERDAYRQVAINSQADAVRERREFFVDLEAKKIMEGGK